jgi:hypothetical protein
MLRLKSALRRLLRGEDPWGDFRRLRSAIHPDAWRRLESVRRWLDLVGPRAADVEAAANYASFRDPVVRRGYDLRERAKRAFADKYAALPRVRLLVFVPDYEMSPAGHSLARNFGAGFAFLGVPTAYWDQGLALAPLLDAFRPTVLLANDPEKYAPEGYLDYIDWGAVGDYRKAGPLSIGLVASPYRKAPSSLRGRLRHARRLGVDFYYSFQAPSFIARRHEGYFRAGFHVSSLEFGANPLLHYPVPGVERDLEYAFLGSAHFEKWPRYCRFFQPIVRSAPGVIVGPGWHKDGVARLPESQHRYLYARAKVGLNLHVPFQIEAAAELNERAYALAACGTPQLMDDPKLLGQRFGPKSVYSASTPREYEELFFRILRRPEEARERALNALEDVFAGHTIFHRAEAFLHDLMENVAGRDGRTT